MTSILFLVGVSVIGVCLLFIALSDRQRVSTIQGVDVGAGQRSRSNPQTARAASLQLQPAAERTLAAPSSRTRAWQPSPPGRLL